MNHTYVELFGSEQGLMRLRLNPLTNESEVLVSLNDSAVAEFEPGTPELKDLVPAKLSARDHLLALGLSIWTFACFYVVARIVVAVFHEVCTEAAVVTHWVQSW